MKGLYGNLTGAALYNARSILCRRRAPLTPSLSVVFPQSSMRSLSRRVYKICAGDEDYLVQRSEMILHSHTIHVSRDGDNDAFNTQQNRRATILYQI